MTNRVTIFMSLSMLSAFAGCSGSGATPAIPLGDAARQNAFAAEPAFPKHVRIRQFPDLPHYGDYYSPSAVAVGAGGKLWVTDTIDQDFGENAVVEISSSGKRRNSFYYPGLTSEGASFGDLASGDDGALWITDSYNLQIVRLSAGRFTNYPVNAAPFGIANGPDKNLWFTAAELGVGNAIGRITTKGKLTLFPLSPQVDGIAAGPDGAL